MTATTDLRVEMDDALRQRPDLLPAAESATEFLDDFVRGHAATFGDDRAMTWRYQPAHPDGEGIVVTYSERDDLGNRVARLALTPNQMLDSGGRNYRVSKILHDIIAQQWKQMDADSAARRDSSAEEE